MKLLDENGRFAFIKNGQVKINKNLPKYNSLGCTSGKTYSQDDDTPFNVVNSPIIYMSTENGDIVQTTGNNRVHVDEKLRNVISEIEPSNIIKYLQQPDAKEFNARFHSILNAEVSSNGSSIIVSDNMWEKKDVNNNDEENKTFFSRIIQFLEKFFHIKNEENEIEMSVLDVFNNIHVIAGKERNFVDRIEGYFSLLEGARKMDQTAQVDKICQHIMFNIYESVLMVNGYNRYITFREIEKIKKVGCRLVDIDYVENFARTIPEDVIRKKEECDKMHIFDNYVVLYYDPSGKTYERTSEAKRDPILFGVINHCEKLYFVADWVDELCDLTLDKIAENYKNLKIGDIEKEEPTFDVKKRKKKQNQKKNKELNKQKNL